ncbi:HlyD family secretion protein [Rhizobium leguminosarum]|uniref:HlyD family secretion protein n=1 Tax=Rhizobium leguminosarum TaxID=384 RepID=UPI0013F16058|nr:HlyD family secretion protein [Rhizobium leguminosarum]
MKEGDLLFTIDSRRLKQAVAQSQANLDAKVAALANNKQGLAQSLADVDLQNAKIVSAEASQVKAAADEERAQRLVRNGSGSQSEDDAATAAFKEAVALVQQAKAALQSSQQAVESVRVNEQALDADVEAAKVQLNAALIDLGYATIKAPSTGKLSEVSVRRGQYVTPRATLAYIVPSQRWVIANYKEAQTRNMQPGQRAWFSVDALGPDYVRGTVENIAPATGAQFSALKPDNATGNFTKVPQRIPVRIKIDDNQAAFDRLGPGMSVVIFVDTSGGPGKCR